MAEVREEVKFSTNLDSIEKDFDSFIKKAEEADNSLDALKNKLDKISKSGKFKDNTKDLLEFGNEVNEAIHNVNDLSRELEKNKSNFVDYNKALGRSFDVDIATSEITKLSRSLTELHIESQLPLFKNLRDTATSEIAEITVEIDKMKKNLDFSDLDSLQQRVKELEDLRNTISDMNEGLKEYADALKESGSEPARAFSSASSVLSQTEASLQGVESKLNSVVNASERFETFKEKFSSITEESKNIQDNIRGITVAVNGLQDTSNITELSSKFEDISARINSAYSDINKFKQSISSKRGDIDADIFEKLNRDVDGFKEELRNLQNISITDSILPQINSIKSDIDVVSEKFKTMLQTGDMSGIRQYSGELGELQNRINTLRESLGSDVFVRLNIDTTQFDNELNIAQQRINEIASNVRTEQVASIKPAVEKVLSQVTNIAKQSFKTTFNAGKTYVKSWGSFLAKTFNSVVSGWKNKLKDIFSPSNTGISSLKSELMSLLGIFSAISLGKSAVNYSSSLIEVQNVTDNVFKSMSEDIDEFTKFQASKFGIISLQAKEMIGVYGGMLKASGLADRAQTEMSKNLVALTGDIASFYNMDIDTVFKKLQSGIAGNVQAMRSFGVNMTVANLDAFALSKGITKSYQAMTQAEKTTLRYNYILEQLSVAQGDFVRTQGSWANQTRQLSNNFKELLSILGGGLIKVLYPAVQLLNQLVVAAINAANALAKLFGFSGKDLSELFGGSGGLTFPDTSEYVDGMEDAADATDDLAKATKNANDNLQQFDKLNNMTTKNSAVAGQTGVGGLGGLLDFDSYYENVDDLDENNKIQEWLDGLWEKLSEHDYYGAGAYIADSINNMMTRINESLTENGPDIQNKMHSLNDGLTDFLSGLLEINTETIGKNIGLLTNLVVYYFNDLYTQLHDNGILDKTGEKIADFFNGLSDTIDWNGVGSLFTTGIRTAFDILSGFLSRAKPEDYAISFKDFLLGAIDRLFGNGGAEEIGNSLAGVINFALTLITGTFGDGEVIKQLGDGIVEMLNSAIDGIDEQKLKEALSVLLSNIGRLLSNIANNTNFSELGEKLGNAVNGAVEDGSVSEFVRGLTDMILGAFDFLSSFIDTVNWWELGVSILDGIASGMKDHPEGSSLLLKAFKLIFGAKLLSNVGSFGIDILGKTIVNKLSGSIAGSGLAASLKGILSSAFGTAAVGTGAIAAEALIGKFLYDLQRDNKLQEMADYRKTYIDDFVLDTERITQQTSLSLEEEAAITKDTISSLKETLTDYGNEIQRIAEDDNWFDALVGTQDREDLIELKAQMRDYIEVLKEAGFADNEYVIEAEKLANSFSFTAMGMSADVNNIVTLLGMLTVELQNNENQFEEAGILTADAYTSSLETAVAIGTEIVGEGSRAMAELFIENAESTIDGEGHRVEESVRNVTEEAVSEGSTIFDGGGREIGEIFIANTEDTINGEGSRVEASVRQVIDNAVDGGNSVAESKSKPVGHNIVEGMKAGIDEKSDSLFQKVTNLAGNILDAFKNALVIESPSKKFKDIAKWIPLGAVKGIEETEDAAYDKMNELSSGMIKMFDVDDIDLSEMIDVSKFQGVFEEVYEKYDMFTDELSDRISKTKLASLQSDILLSPSFKKQSIDTALEQSQSNERVISSLGNIYSKIGKVDKGSGRPVYVSVYLDSNNKLEDFIIDTVNGRVVKGGNF